MDLRRLLTPRRPVSPYQHAIRDVLGPPARRHPDTLAVLWAHQIAWAAHGGAGADELDLLSSTAAQYHVSLEAVLEERCRQQSAGRVMPAHRPTPDATTSVRKLSRPA